MLGLLLLTAAATAALPEPAPARTARCVIVTNDATYRGPCVFNPDRGGSFSVSKPGGGPILPNITDVSVFILAPGRADVRGLTTDGINSRWGSATRSATDRACWVGSDFRICAY